QTTLCRDLKGDRQMRTCRNTSTTRKRVCRRIHLIAPRAGIFYPPVAYNQAAREARGRTINREFVSDRNLTTGHA
ncbi:MAG: hypothetical protein KDA47_10115, partial [Planctomycetales bacterium]|nr:hypothetical protein [Planctomycetales bacterium]